MFKARSQKRAGGEAGMRAFRHYCGSVHAAAPQGQTAIKASDTTDIAARKKTKKKGGMQPDASGQGGSGPAVIRTAPSREVIPSAGRITNTCLLRRSRAKTNDRRRGDPHPPGPLSRNLLWRGRVYRMLAGL
jgi:hypothetical protein